MGLCMMSLSETYPGPRVHEWGGSPIPQRFSSGPLVQEISNVNPSTYHEVEHTTTNPLTGL